MNRPSGRQPDQIRPVKLTRHYTKYAEGSVLVEFGDTKVICNATVTEGVPRFLREEKSGWITAEYGMLPRSTDVRMDREAARGKQSGRTVEIQRLIGRSLRAAVDLKLLGQNTITIDCDIIQADGGTRTAAITGGYVALADACSHMITAGILNKAPLTRMIAAISVGVYQGAPVADLDYAEDSSADTDMNIVMADDQGIIEIQGTAEKQPFSESEFASMMSLAKQSVSQLHELQRQCLGMDG